MNTIKIEKSKLLIAMEYSEIEDVYYLNRKMGEIEQQYRRDSFGFEWIDDFEENNDDFVENDIYIRIPQISPSEGYQIMVAFIEQLNYNKLQSRLLNNIKKNIHLEVLKMIY